MLKKINKNVLLVLMITSISGLIGCSNSIDKKIDNDVDDMGIDIKNVDEEEPKISEEEAVNIANEFLKAIGKNTEDQTVMDNITYSDSYASKIHIIEYEGRERVVVSVDALTGEVLNIISYGQANEDNAISIEYEDAKEQAFKLLANLYPNRIDRIEIVEDGSLFSDGNNYSFIFRRIENNIPFHYNGMVVSIDKYSGELSFFNVNWNDNVDIPEAIGIKDKEAMDKKLRDSLEVILQYKSINNPNSLDIVYSLDSSNSFKIDANSGEFIQSNYGKNGIKVNEEMRNKYIEEAKKNIRTKAITKEKVEEIAENIIRDCLFTDLEIVGISEEIQNSNGIKNKLWNVNFAYDNNSVGMMYLSEFGELIKIYMWRKVPSLEEKERLTQKEISNRTLDILVKYMPSKLVEIDLDMHINKTKLNVNNTENQEKVHITLDRFINEIYCYGDSVQLSSDVTTGIFTEIYTNFRCFKHIDSLDSLISKEEALNKFLDIVETKVFYEIYEEEKSEEDKTKEFKARLIYLLKLKGKYEYTSNTDGISIHGISGKTMDNNGID